MHCLAPRCTREALLHHGICSSLQVPSQTLLCSVWISFNSLCMWYLLQYWTIHWKQAALPFITVLILTTQKQCCIHPSLTPMDYKVGMQSHWEALRNGIIDLTTYINWTKIWYTKLDPWEVCVFLTIAQLDVNGYPVVASLCNQVPSDCTERLVPIMSKWIDGITRI